MTPLKPNPLKPVPMKVRWAQDTEPFFELVHPAIEEKINEILGSLNEEVEAQIDELLNEEDE